MLCNIGKLIIIYDYYTHMDLIGYISNLNWSHMNAKLTPGEWRFFRVLAMHESSQGPFSAYQIAQRLRSTKFDIKYVNVRKYIRALSEQKLVVEAHPKNTRNFHRANYFQISEPGWCVFWAHCSLRELLSTRERLISKPRDSDPIVNGFMASILENCARIYLMKHFFGSIAVYLKKSAELIISIMDEYGPRFLKKSEDLPFSVLFQLEWHVRTFLLDLMLRFSNKSTIRARMVVGVDPVFAKQTSDELFRIIAQDKKATKVIEKAKSDLTSCFNYLDLALHA
jgi:hypothetical protein